MIDTHVHVIAEDEAARPLQPMSLSGAWYREAPCSAERLLDAMDASGDARRFAVALGREAVSLPPADDRARCLGETAAKLWMRG